MVDAFTSTSALSNIVQPAVDQYIRAELRHQPMLRAIADTRPVQVNMPGSSVALYIHGDLAPATTPLSETADPDAVALPNPTAVTLTPNEYGNATISTLKVNATSFFDVDPYQRDAVMWNMRDTLDKLVYTVLGAGDNAIYSGGNAATDDLTTGDVLTADDVRRAVTRLRSNAAPGKRGDLYWAGVHPDVSADLRTESGAGSWQDLHKYAAPGEFWPGTIGVFEGAVFVESARLTSTTNANATPVDVYKTIFAGREALAEGVVVEPEVRIGVVPDKLNRFFPLGWYGYLGWTIFRQKCLYRVESASNFTA